MGSNLFSDEDLKQIRDHGLTTEAAQRHLELFKMSPPYLRLLRPCIPWDGIKVIDPDKMQALRGVYDLEAPKRNCTKFVPASGAASRMFKTLLRLLNQDKEIIREPISAKAQKGQKDALDLIRFMDGTNKFAFYEDLKTVMSENGLNTEALLEEGRFTEVIRFLLTEAGLDYAALPKGLLKFHRYAEGSRTAFEEHMVEAASYVADQNGKCCLHFTVSSEHMEEFRKLLEKVQPVYEKQYHVSFHITFSVQKESTDTLAVDLENNPFRQKDGTLLFRPGGHGSLIENLNDLGGDILFIKNIDNVVPDRLKEETFRWKKILGGYLLNIQTNVFKYVERLLSDSLDDSLISEILAFVRDELCLTLPNDLKNDSIEAKKVFLMEKLNRPIRVCGMVRNVGEPGGGPFWVQDQTGEDSRQIVETAQIDSESRDQQDILESSTHFNPVDLVCAVRDYKGRPFDLRKYVDPNAVFISKKSKDGKDLKALEHPGLWNGAMSKWITIFIEVPIITFNPVKTVNDLLREQHQPAADKNS